MGACGVNTPAVQPTLVPARSWNQVEKGASLFLLTVLLCVLGMRLGFSGVWPMPRLDFDLSAVALVVVLASFWLARTRRGLRLGAIAFAGATQLVPMVVREPVLLFPLLGGLIPVAILVGCLIALAHKGRPGQSPPRS